MASGSGKGHFNPRSPHGERRHLYGDLSRLWHFNPRSPHGERRDGSSLSIIDFVFQPTLPARGATKMTTGLRASTFEFQPTLPARGATVSRDVSGRPGANFNPRSPHGERQFRATFQGDPEQISTHAPRTGSDFDLFFAHAVNGRFQPTLPARGATRCPMIQAMVVDHFNPRSPHGERRA